MGIRLSSAYHWANLGLPEVAIAVSPRSVYHVKFTKYSVQRKLWCNIVYRCPLTTHLLRVPLSGSYTAVLCLLHWSLLGRPHRVVTWRVEDINRYQQLQQQIYCKCRIYHNTDTDTNIYPNPNPHMYNLADTVTATYPLFPANPNPKLTKRSTY